MIRTISFWEICQNKFLMKTEDLPIPNLSILELFLLQIVGYAILWLISDYTATLVTIILPIIFFSLLLLACLSELVQKSKVPRQYYYFMLVSILAPILTAAIFVLIIGVDFDWKTL